jgi:hypothetical protein
MKLFRNYALTMLATLLLGGLFSAPASGQFVGYTSPQTVNQQIFAGVNTSQTSPVATFPCTPTPSCGIPNIGQSIHYVTVRASAARNFRLTLQGSNDGVSWFDMSESSSDAGLNGGTPGFAGFAASGSFNAYRLNLQVGNGSGTLSVWYAGTSVSNGTTSGNFNQSTQNRRVLALAPNTSLTLTAGQVTQYPPAGNTSGTVYFQFQANPCAGGSLIVQSGADSQHLTTIATLVPVNISTLQALPIPSSNAASMAFSYTACGTETYDAFMEFSQPGTFNGFLGTNITTTTATAVKATAGVVHTLTVNTGGAGTIILFDLAAAGCTGTPATNQKATITATATTLQTFTYDMNFLNGICAKSSVAMDYTISFQ